MQYNAAQHRCQSVANASSRKDFDGHVKRGEPPLRGLGALTALLVPVFFRCMGMLVDMQSFASPSVLGFAMLLTLAAILGKLACGAVAPKGVSGLTLGLGMMPRGEVGMMFAGIGAQLVLAGRPVSDPATYAAAVFNGRCHDDCNGPALAVVVEKMVTKARSGRQRTARAEGWLPGFPTPSVLAGITMRR